MADGGGWLLQEDGGSKTAEACVDCTSLTCFTSLQNDRAPLRASSSHFCSSSGSIGTYSLLRRCRLSLAAWVAAGARRTPRVLVGPVANSAAVVDVLRACWPTSSIQASIPPFKRIGGFLSGLSKLNSVKVSYRCFKAASSSVWLCLVRKSRFIVESL